MTFVQLLPRCGFLLPVAAVMGAAMGCFATFLPLGSAGAAEFRIRQQDDALDVEIDGQPFTTYLHQGFAKPILYPIIGPYGIAMTRNFPMKKVAGEATDHHHQKSMWFTHGNINGIDFWAEEPAAGRIVQTKLLRAEGGKDRATIETTNDWVSPKGDVLLSDRRLLSFLLVPGGRAIDWQIDLHANHGPLTFGDTKEGTLGIRIRSELNLHNDPDHDVTTANGHAINSEGLRDADIWAKRANWVDYWGNIKGKTVGVAVFDHPANPRHPTWWHARDYGLIAANPFGIHAFEPDKPAGVGALTIPAGKSLTFRYRFIFHRGDAAQANIARQYEQYTKP
jgi:hypothetical protein